MSTYNSDYQSHPDLSQLSEAITIAMKSEEIHPDSTLVENINTEIHQRLEMKGSELNHWELLGDESIRDAIRDGFVWLYPTSTADRLTNATAWEFGIAALPEYNY